MAYEPKINNGSLFKNDRKEKETHPDYNGTIMLEDGLHYLSAWVKLGAKGKFLSVSIGKLKDGAARTSSPKVTADEVLDGGAGFTSDDVPFAYNEV